MRRNCAIRRSELVPTRDVVVVQMRFEDVRDAESTRARRVEVDVDVTSRVDHHGDASRLVGDQRAEVSEPLDDELLEAHRPRLH